MSETKQELEELRAKVYKKQGKLSEQDKRIIRAIDDKLRALKKPMFHKEQY